MNKRLRKKRDPFKYAEKGLAKAIVKELAWDVDMSTALFVSRILEIFIRDNNGWDPERFKDIKEYHKKLTEIKEACDDYLTRWDHCDIDKEIVQKEKFIKEMHEFADLLPGLWW